MSDAVIQFEGTIYEDGYGLLAQKVMRDKSLPKQSKLIYAYMCSFAGVKKDGERTAFPSVELQCGELGMSEDTYYKWRKPLIDNGYIKITRQRKEGNKFDNNIYSIMAVPVEQKPEEETPEKKEEKPYPRKSGTEKPYPKFSSTENPSTENSGTNSNSFNSNIFKRFDDDEYIISEISNNDFFISLISFFEQKNVLNKKRDSLDVVRYLLKENHSIFTMKDIELAFETYRKEVAMGRVTKRSSYFSSLLIDASEKNRLRADYELELEQQRLRNQNRDLSIYYNWLEER